MSWLKRIQALRLAFIVLDPEWRMPAHYRPCGAIVRSTHRSVAWTWIWWRVERLGSTKQQRHPEPESACRSMITSRETLVLRPRRPKTYFCATGAYEKTAGAVQAWQPTTRP